ncbi:YggT family protein [Streptococcus plurextorum]|uniref:YggT family protein n=1 Tax=Streptococcus plurextorum TaxID=456876 RepID=UPI000488D315|nr:YggT family protein [Streptococcus plurextorum]
MSYYIFSILVKVLEVYMGLLGIYALLSWFPGAYQTGFGRLIRYFVDPLVLPFRRFNLRFGLIDITVLVVFATLQFLRYFLIQLYSGLLGLW